MIYSMKWGHEYVSTLIPETSYCTLASLSAADVSLEIDSCQMNEQLKF